MVGSARAAETETHGSVTDTNSVTTDCTECKTANQIEQGGYGMPEVLWIVVVAMILLLWLWLWLWRGHDIVVVAM